MQITFGERLMFYRKRAGWTQKQLAEYLSVSTATISNYEKNITRPDAEKMMQISNAFGISISQLLDLRSPQEESKALFEQVPAGAKAPDAGKDPLLGQRLMCYNPADMTSPRPVRSEELERFVDDYTKHFCMETEEGLSLFYIQTVAEPGDIMLVRQQEKPPQLAVFNGECYDGGLQPGEVQVLGKKIISIV